MSSVTLLDLAKLKNGSDGVLHLIDAVGKSAPEVLALPADTIKGTDYDVTLVTAYPQTGFRNVNQGVPASKASFETRKAQCHILDARIEVDKAAARMHDKGPDALMAKYAALTMKSSLLTMGNQTFYGTALDGKGFPGLSQMAPASMTVDATGSTADAATSVYIIFGGEFGVQYIFGEDSTFDLQPFVDGEGTDADGNKFAAHVAYLNCRPGLSCASPFAVGRIKNITAQAGKGVTDSLISQLIEKFPTDCFPTHIMMNRTARGQLQRNRTVVLNGGGSGKPKGDDGNVAPIPTEAFGVPIICTDSLVSTEAIA